MALYWLAALGAVFFIVFWSQVLRVPFWQDDYSNLFAARQSCREGTPWFAFLLESPQATSQWRPLSFYWPAVERLWGGNVRAAHAFNIALLLLATVEVGWLATLLLRTAWPAADAAWGGLLAALLYGLHPAHFLARPGPAPPTRPS